MAEPPFDYDAIPAGYYDEVYRRRGPQSKWHHLKFAHLARRLGRFEHLLDLGCGPGTFLGNLPLGGEAIGVDIAAAQIAYAREHYEGPGRHFQVVPPDALPFADDAFDAVTSVEVLEHLDEPTTEHLLAEAWRVLRPGGRLLVTTPNYGSGWPLLEWGVNRLATVTYEAQHISKYRRASLHARLAALPGASVAVTAFQGFGFGLAALHWDWADRLPRWQPPVPFGGLLLLGEARK